ncbi:MAG: hypothetical protein EB025_02670 [Chitinophagaceae bacterium]|nr:hypothetical protein [Chitinophagaceae bacterium]
MNFIEDYFQGGRSDSFQYIKNTFIQFLLINSLKKTVIYLVERGENYGQKQAATDSRWQLSSIRKEQ